MGGKVPKARLNNTDLRLKVSPQNCTSYTRTILRNSVTRLPVRVFTSEDAPAVLLGHSRNFQRTVPKAVPFIISKESINSDLKMASVINRGRSIGRARPPLRRIPRKMIPDMLSLPTVVSTSAGLIRRATAPGGLSADLAIPSEALLALRSSTADMKLKLIPLIR